VSHLLRAITVAGRPDDAELLGVSWGQAPVVIRWERVAQARVLELPWSEEPPPPKGGGPEARVEAAVCDTD